jgi:hypothetical protein
MLILVKGGGSLGIWNVDLITISLFFLTSKTHYCSFCGMFTHSIAQVFIECLLCARHCLENENIVQLGISEPSKKFK